MPMKPVLKTGKSEMKPLISPPSELGVPSGPEEELIVIVVVVVIIIMVKESEDEVDTDCLYCAGL